MTTIEEAAAICSNAEKALRQLMQTAITSGEYRHLPALARMAEQISQLAVRASLTVEQSPLAMETESLPSRGRQIRKCLKSGAHISAQRRSNLPKPSVRSAKIGYPKFRRDGDEIVKIGWSKKSRTEYEHRAQKRVVDAVIKAVDSVGQKNKVFTVESLLPIKDAADGTEIPAYQVYLALAWFRTEGLVNQQGREGYSLLVTANIEKTVEDRWTALPDDKTTRKEDRP